MNIFAIIEWGWVGYEGLCRCGCYPPSEICRILHILRKPNSIMVLLFLQNNSKFKNKLKHANLGRWTLISVMHLYRGNFRKLRSAQVYKYALQIADVVVELSSCCSCEVFRQCIAVKRVKCSATVPPFCFNYQNNSTSSPGFPGQRFNNLQPGCTFDTILTLSVQYDEILSKFGQQQLVMVNYYSFKISLRFWLAKTTRIISK